MKLRTIAALIGALAVASAPFVMAVSGGGFPSFPQFLGVGVNTPALTTQGLTVQNVSPNVTAIQAKNDTAHDSEILVSTSTAGNSQFRATNFGGVNWSFGNLRSDNSYDVCNAATLSTGCALSLASAGPATFSTTTQTFPQLSVTGTATSPGPLGANVRNQISTGYSTFRLYNDQNSGARALELDYSGSAYASNLSTSGPSGESAAVSTTGAFPLCVGTANTCVIEIDGAKNITTPGAASVPWATGSTQTTTTSSATSVGCTAALGSTWRYVKTGNSVVVSIDPFQCTSNSTAFSFTSAVPAAMQPARNQYCAIHVNDNSINQVGLVQFSAGSTTAQLWTGNTAAGAWTASGGKGLGFGNGSCSYLLN